MYLLGAVIADTYYQSAKEQESKGESERAKVRR